MAFDVLERRMEHPERERELLWLAMHSAEHGPVVLDEATPLLFNNPARRQLLLHLQHMFIAGQHVHPDAVMLRLEAKADPASLPVLQREFGIVLEAKTGLLPNELLDDLDLCYRCRTVNQKIFIESLGRFRKNEDIHSIVEDMAQLLVTLDPMRDQQEDIAETMAEVIDDAKNPKPNKRGLLTGLRAFDLQFGGVKRDRVNTIAANTGTGKTALVVDLIFRLLSKYHDKVFIKFYSLEMSNYRIAQRLLSRQAYVSVTRQEDWSQEGHEALTDEEVKRMDDALPHWHEWKKSFEVTYTTISAREIKADCRRCALRPENKDKHLIFFVDHIGLVEKESDDNRKEFDKIMIACKDVARDLKATVFPLVQLGKSVENEFNEKNYFKPTAAHVMETVGVKATSDNLMLLWRPGMYEKFHYIAYGDEMSFDVREAMFIIADKARDGAPGTELLFQVDMKHNHIRNWQGPEPGGTLY